MSPSSLLFWLSVACCGVAQVLIVRSILGVRGADAQPGLPRSRGAVEVFWAVLPAVALGALLLFTWRAIETRETLRAAATAETAR